MSLVINHDLNDKLSYLNKKIVNSKYKNINSLNKRTDNTSDGQNKNIYNFFDGNFYL